MRHRFGSGVYDVVEDDVCGHCIAPQRDHYGEIWLRPGQHGLDELDSAIHEALHAEHEAWTERQVRRRAATLAGYLWKLGWRRTGRKRRPLSMADKKLTAKKKRTTRAEYESDAPIKWDRRPSVRRGGKPYFWTSRVGDRRYWVVWDRVDERWVVQEEHVRTGESSPDVPAASPSRGRAYVRKLVEARYAGQA